MAAIVNGELRPLKCLKKSDHIRCEECMEPLILRDGIINRKHLAHRGFSHCANRVANTETDNRGGEGPMHYFAKERVCQLFNDRSIQTLTVVQKFCNCPAKEIDLMQFRTDDNIISTEVWDSVYKKRYDVAIRDKTTREIIFVIEILRTHRTDESARNYPWCELSAEKIHEVDVRQFQCQRKPALTCIQCLEAEKLWMEKQSQRREAERLEREAERTKQMETLRIRLEVEKHRLECQQIEKEKREAERIKRIEAQRWEAERLEAERIKQLEAERMQKEAEKQRRLAIFKIISPLLAMRKPRRMYCKKIQAIIDYELIMKLKKENDKVMRIKSKEDARLMRIKEKEDKEQCRIKAEEDAKIERIQNDAAREKMRALKEREKQAKRQINCARCKTYTCMTCRIKIQTLCK